MNRLKLWAKAPRAHVQLLLSDRDRTAHFIRADSTNAGKLIVWGQQQ